ncbi:MAG TPA: DUF4145 domain-containing protein [Terracidiphilus sp.]
MANFDFLKSYNRNLAKAGKHAEEYIYSNPNACAIELRFIAESIAQTVRKEKGLKFERKTTREGQDPSFDENLTAIKCAHIATQEIINDFHQNKNVGNKAAHGHSVTIEEALDSFESTHRIAVWYAREYKRSSLPIPGVILPEPGSTEETKNSISKLFLDTPAKRWIAGIFSTFGLLWLWQFIADKEHRWDASLVKSVRIAFILGILILLALPIMIVAHIATLWGTYSYFVSYLSGELGWNSYLIRALVLAFLLPFLYAVKMFASPLNKEKRMRGAILLIVMVVGYNFMLYSATKNVIFNAKDGHPVKYYMITDQGIVTHDRPGYDEASGQLLLPMTPEIWRDYTIQGNATFTKVDPQTAVWFNQNNGNPMLWYNRSSNGDFVFYNRWGNDPQTGDRLLPVTKEVQKTWEAEEAIAKQKNAPADPLMKALNPGAGKSEPGIYLRSQDEAGREGIDALEIPPSGLNRSALRADVIERQGYGNRLYDGDPGLLRKVFSVTRLNSLVVANVTVKCEKRSTVDADLLSCDLTANARKFDANGNLAGSVLAHGTGAGFNQAYAIHQAAQRASGDLLALARK